ncbi:MAG: S-layer homology domain-containing protein, partial [Ruminiclostridium sp.]|nr:S-layer homology domain-containing protein [Ruminiclostridium sp.]
SVPKNAEVGEDSASTYFDSMVGAYVRSFTIRAYETQEYVSIDGVGEVPETTEKTAAKSTYYGSVTMNAETGDILTFSGSDTRTITRAVKSESHAKSLLNSYLKRILNDRAESFVLNVPHYYYLGKDRDGNLTENSYLSTVSAESPRYAYGIPCDREKVSMTIDQSGRVSRYNITWYGIEYPKPENILTEDEVYTKYFEQTEYNLLYRIAYNRKEKRMETALVYNAGNDFRIDAFSGKLVNYYGEEVSVKKNTGYTDLKQSGYREEAEKLALYGITLMDEEGRLNADMAITREEFRDLVRYIGVYYYKVENGEKPLTRKYAAKILAGYSQIAEIPNLFKSPYSDVSEDDKYVGYIALATAQGYIKGEKGKFRPSAQMTRGDALLLVYDYLNR